MRYFKLGENDSYSIMHFLFYTGLIVVAYRAVQFGKWVRLKGVSERLQQSVLDFQQVGAVAINGTAFDTVIGIIFGIAYLIVIALIWRFVCELLLIFFRYFENNTGNNK